MYLRVLYFVPTIVKSIKFFSAKEIPLYGTMLYENS